MTNFRESSIAAADSQSVDDFSRWRVSNALSLFASKLQHDKQPLFWSEEVNGTATSVWSESKVTLSVSANNDFAIRKCFQPMNYQPGKGQRIFTTGVLGVLGADLVSYVGYYDTNTVAPFNSDRDGLCFQNVNGTIQVAIWRGGVQLVAIDQSNWNKDTMDGNGPSGITVDFDKPQIFAISFQYLGLGRVRYGIDIDGILYTVHEINNANNLSTTQQPYMLTPNHSVRYEIRSTGGSGSIVQVCSEVESEGGVDRLGITRAFNIGILATEDIDTTSPGVKYGVAAIRLKDTHLDCSVDLESLSVMSDSGANFVWELWLNPTYDGGSPVFAYADETNSQVQTARGATGDNNAPRITGGTLLDCGYVSNNQDATPSALKNARRLGSAIDGTRDEMVLTIAAQANEDVYGSIQWREGL